MKNLFFAAAVVVASTLAVAPSVSDAKRFGGGSSSGMQRSMPSAAPAKPAGQQAAPAAAPTAAGAAPAAAAAKRSWMGPIAGLAAGLGIAALMSHLGLGEAFGNFLMMALLAMAAIFAIRFLMRRAAPPGRAARAAGPGRCAAGGAELGQARRSAGAGAQQRAPTSGRVGRRLDAAGADAGLDDGLGGAARPAARTSTPKASRAWRR